MERLTTKRRDGRWALRNDDGATPKEQINKIPRAIDRLATYEDTGLEPETVSDLLERFIFFYRMVEGLDLIDPVHFGAFVDRVKRWQRAEKDGRLVVLPCKLTDTVYVVETVMKGKKHIGEKVVSAQIDHVTIGESGKPVLDVCTETGNWYGPLEAGEFYLTSQEAEEELRKEGENG